MHEKTSQMIALYERGYSSISIGSMLGLASCTVSRNLKLAGVTMARKGQRHLISEEYVAMARAMKEQKIPWEHISRKIGFSVRQLQFYVNGK